MKVCPICQERHDDSTACEVDHTSRSLESIETEPEVPGFRLDHQLSSAHDSQTYRARDVGSGRTCLIKVVAASEDDAKQAIREAKIAANLFHPSVANFYDCGRLEDGRYFFAFEDVQGRSLREILDSDGIPDLLDTIEVVREAAEALHALHRNDIIHGSVNPTNIIVSITADGQPIVRVTDPDLGRLAQRSIISNRFLIDNELDTLRYFSPEQCSSNDATAQSDVYSLGVVFYEMLAGFPPFDATTAVGLIQQHMNQPPPDIRIENFNLRMLVTHALTEALQKPTRLRQPSINTLARQLRHIEQLATHSSTPPPAGTVREQTPAIVPTPETAMPEIGTQPKSVVLDLSEALRHETVHDDVPDTVRHRMISLDEALEEDRATLTNLEAQVELRPSRLQAWKEKLQSLTAMFAIERVGEDHAEPVERVSMDELESITTSAFESVSRIPKKIEWVQPEDDIPSIDEVREILAVSHDVVSTIEPVTLSARDTEIEPARRTPTKIEWALPDDDIPSLDDVREVIATESFVAPPIAMFESEPESSIAPSWEPEPQIVNVAALEMADEVAAIEPTWQLEPETISLESTVPEQQELVVEAPVPALVVEPPTSVSALKQFAMAAVQKHKKSGRRKEVAPVVEPLQSEPEIIHLEEIVAEPQQHVAELEATAPEPEIVDVPLSPMIAQAIKPSAIAAVRKRHKKVSRKQPIQLSVEGPSTEVDIARVENTQPDIQEVFLEAPPQEIQVEPETSETQEIVVESESQHVLVESAVETSETDLIHVESATSEPQEIVVEPDVVQVEAAESKIEINTALAPEPDLAAPPPVIASAPQQLAVPKRHKKSSRRQPTAFVPTPISADDEEITIVRTRTKTRRVRIHVSGKTKPHRSPRPQSSPVRAEPEFFPTLLGGGLEPEFAIPQEGNAMFGAYASESSGSISRYRSHLIGGGVIAVLAIFLYGSNLLTGYFRSESGRLDESPAARPEEAKPIRSTLTQPVASKPNSDKPAVDKKDRTSPKAKEPGSTSIPHETLTKAMILLPSKAAQIETMSQSDTAPPRRKATQPKSSPAENVTRPRVVKDPPR